METNSPVLERGGATSTDLTLLLYLRSYDEGFRSTTPAPGPWAATSVGPSHLHGGEGLGRREALAALPTHHGRRHLLQSCSDVEAAAVDLDADIRWGCTTVR
jgi:hypothetical protein